MARVAQVIKTTTCLTSAQQPSCKQISAERRRALQRELKSKSCIKIPGIEIHGINRSLSVLSLKMLEQRISTSEEWEELQKSGSTSGGDIDKTTGCIHLSKLDQVKGTLENFFQGREDLYLLQIDTKKLGDGLVYEAVDNSNFFPHFYGPSRSFIPLPLDAVTKAEKLTLTGGKFSCSLL